jgi:hypothetical protein
MKRNLIIFNLGLLLLAAFLLQQLKSQWIQFDQIHQTQRLTPRSPEGKKGANKSALALAGTNDYFAIVNQDLFASDRTNLIPPEPPPPPPMKKDLPPKPILSGIFRLGGSDSVLMISSDPKAKGSQKRLYVGEKMDSYTLEEILDQRIRMKVESGEEVEIRLNEPAGIVPKDSYTERTPAWGGSGSKVVAVGGSASSPETSSQVSSTKTAAAAPPPAPEVPVGTIVNGKRKVVTQTPFGKMESWEDVR